MKQGPHISRGERLQQFYAEAKIEGELARNGGHIAARHKDENGDIVLMCGFEC